MVNFITQCFGSPLEKIEASPFKSDKMMIDLTSECSECLDNYKETPEGQKNVYSLTVLKCGHVFHEYCLTQWENAQDAREIEERRGSYTCPICRAVYGKETTLSKRTESISDLLAKFFQEGCLKIFK